MLIFAYGSSLDFNQMRVRCPPAQFVSKAKLEGHRLLLSANQHKSRLRRCIRRAG